MHMLLRNTILLLFCAIGLASSGALGLFERPSLAQDDLATARARWRAHAPTHYLLKVEEQSLGVACQQEIEIRYEQIAAIVENTCTHQPWTVGKLFERVTLDRRHKASVLAGCIVAGCACLRTPAFWASYDVQLGYPSERRMSVVLADNWLHGDFWRLALWLRRLPDCSAAIAREVLTAKVLPATERLAEIHRL